MSSETANASLADEVERAVLEELDKCRDKVIERIAKTRTLTDTEVYEAGVALNQVVQRAQSYMTDMNARMASSADSQDGIGATLDSIQRIAKTQEELVSNALDHLAGIAKAGRKIQEMSGASRLLALNARVESARFGGEGGRAFNVIADEMRDLSQSVETTNTMVSKLAAELRQSLPNIQVQTRSMGESIASLVQEMGERNQRLQAVFQESIEAGGEALESVLSSARKGLSHLQFQDLMIQDLEGIERVLRTTHDQVARTLNPSAENSQFGDSAFLGTLGAELDEQYSDQSELDAGEVLLF